jgi:hypothetical protein
MKKRFYLLFAAVLVFSSCGKKAEEVQKEPEISALSSVSEIEEKPQEEEESLEGLAQSPLTGEYIDEEKAVFNISLRNRIKASALIKHIFAVCKKLTGRQKTAFGVFGTFCKHRYFALLPAQKPYPLAAFTGFKCFYHYCLCFFHCHLSVPLS